MGVLAQLGGRLTKMAFTLFEVTWIRWTSVGKKALHTLCQARSGSRQIVVPTTMASQKAGVAASCVEGKSQLIARLET